MVFICSSKILTMTSFKCTILFLIICINTVKIHPLKMNLRVNVTTRKHSSKSNSIKTHGIFGSDSLKKKNIVGDGRKSSRILGVGTVGKDNKEGASRGEKRRVPKSRIKGGTNGGGKDENSNTVDGPDNQNGEDSEKKCLPGNNYNHTSCST